MLSVLSCNIELREKGEEDKECEVLVWWEPLTGAVNILAGSSVWGGGAPCTSPGERLWSSWELRPLARAITAYWKQKKSKKSKTCEKDLDLQNLQTLSPIFDEDGAALLSNIANMNVTGFEINLEVESLDNFSVQLIGFSFQNAIYYIEM